MNEIPVTTRTQRRFERRQMVFMAILILAIGGACLLLGIMIGQRGNFFGARSEPPRLPMVQVAPPPPPPGAVASPQKLTFYDDLPKGNSAPLGSGINLPKGGYSVPPPPSPPAASAPVPAPAAPPVAATPSPTPAPSVPVAAAPAVKPAAVAPPPEKTAPKASAGGAFVVQVVAVRDQAEAGRLVGKLQSKGFAATSEKADLGDKGIWYRVMAGPYGDRAAADNAAAHLKQQGFAAIVRKK